MPSTCCADLRRRCSAPSCGAIALELLKPLETDEHLAGYHRLDAVKAHLLERAGDCDTAVELYRLAATKTSSVPERNYLMLRAAKLEERPA